MSHPYHHALSSSRRWGGKPQDYLKLHNWFDATKAHFPDPRHRAMRHHSEGIFLAEEIFGVTITNSLGQEIPTRILGEQHVLEDLGWIPTMADWLRCMTREPWMNRVPGPDKITDRDIKTRGKAQKPATKVSRAQATASATPQPPTLVRKGRIRTRRYTLQLGT